jgi:hypothetical protein
MAAGQGVLVMVGEADQVGLTVKVCEAVGLALNVGEAVKLGLQVGVRVKVGETVNVGLGVGLGVRVPVGTGWMFTGSWGLSRSKGEFNHNGNPMARTAAMKPKTVRKRKTFCMIRFDLTGAN